MEWQKLLAQQPGSSNSIRHASATDESCGKEIPAAVESCFLDTSKKAS